MQRELIISLVFHAMVLVPLAIVTANNGRQKIDPALYTIQLVELPAPSSRPVRAPEPEIQEEPEVKEVVEEPEPDEPPEVEVERSEPPPEPPKHSAGRVVRRKTTPKEPSLREKIQSRLPEATQEAVQEAPQEAEVEEEQVQSDYSLEVQGFPYQWYVNVVRKRIDQTWIPPQESVISSEVAATVEFTIRKDGTVEGLKLSRPSGRNALNLSATEAVKLSSPFPPLPHDYGSSLEVRVTFRIFPNR